MKKRQVYGTSGLNDCVMFPVEDWMFPLLFEITGVYLDFVVFFLGGGTLQRVSIVMVRSDPLKDILLSMVIGLSSRVLAFPTVAIRTE